MVALPETSRTFQLPLSTEAHALLEFDETIQF
jgi:hypothetical protein